MVQTNNKPNLTPSKGEMFTEKPFRLAMFASSDSGKSHVIK